ncbi:MAG: hypothetical protein QXS37_03640 [Candidatus Aenigmatarchaeota archaeon]
MVFLFSLTLLFLSVRLITKLNLTDKRKLELEVRNVPLWNLCDKIPHNSECIMFNETCAKWIKNELAYAICMASSLFPLNSNYPEIICNSLSLEYWRYHCMAKVISTINLSLSKEICNKIVNNEERIRCIVDVTRTVNINESLEMCNLLENPDKVNYCKADTISLIKKNESLNYCSKIIDPSLRELCFMEIGED